MSELAQNDMTVPSTPKYHKVAPDVLQQYQEQVNKMCDLVSILNFDKKRRIFEKLILSITLIFVFRPIWR